ncbi:MAG: YggS family pyridoxal phosphate-dependent enzyme [Eudoraea sp.]|nr:YggS family pyridoxal phosphate-dependent enzyme [Eudoraea sp.]NNJ37722.1 YggS family pyridoxal phosphate-dependent enzyme [Flavobacteriaceae bacterium]MBT8210519.1 YggS family pyridoxal phosphate-dependent enzyme [Eudoraea sp.]MBT8311319.1 YggS family pyridoxal phosphate-dependent enzyme [Eudoraea sp.]MBT8322583.1 YggS family pyridoxal phosphate-dependent enzyme [Eudoraea sp.]
MSIEENLKKVLHSLPDGVELVAVSKTKSVEEILEAYQSGQRIFGENRVQEMVDKWEVLPRDIQWHMIGHVQRNKVKYMASFVNLIHGVDSLKLLQEINKQAQKNGRKIKCLLQIHIAEESSKFGFDENEVGVLVNSGEIQNLEHIEVCGLMGMATFTEDKEQIRKEFRGLKRLFDKLRGSLPGMQVLSMGMSGDYVTAIEEGSNLVRIGSSIFGARN